VRKDTRDRLLLPLFLPLGGLALIAGVLYGLSRVLLSISHDAATGTALAVAVSIMVSAVLVSRLPVIRASSIASMMGAVVGVAMLAGGIALIAVSPKHEGGQRTEIVQLVAQNIQFAQTSLTVPAGQKFTIAFDNLDTGTQHNVQIFAAKDFSGAPLFDGQLVTGPSKASYDVASLDAGTYYFKCVIHPQMIGTIQAVASGDGGGSDGGGSGGLTITASSLSFDIAEIDLVAGVTTTITFTNNDAGVQHNIAIYTDSSAATNLFKGDLVTGVNTATYAIPALDAGTYYFRCDIHPTMNGKVVVAAAAPAPSGSSPAAPGSSP
jgi:plastocyanin